MKSSIVRTENHDHKVAFSELFFDLVFVLAIIMISHNLVENFNKEGIIQTFFLLLAFWWVWIYTSWATNWLYPENSIVRALIFMVMFLGLLMTVSIPVAFQEGALLFAVSYLLIQVGRTLFMYKAFKHDGIHKRNFFRIMVYFLFSGIFWIAGALDQELRYVLWGVALIIDYGAPMINFWLPKIGKAQSGQWNIRGEHMAERCGLFIIIALGETILVIGRTFVELPRTLDNYLILSLIFFGTVALWWIYFHVGAKCGAYKISNSTNPGSLGRSAYTYFHIFIIAGIILIAASDEFILLHPADIVTTTTMIAIMGGPALYLIGNLLFKRVVYGWFPQSHVYGLVALASLLFIKAPSAILLASLCFLVLALVAIMEGLIFAKFGFKYIRKHKYEK